MNKTIHWSRVRKIDIVALFLKIDVKIQYCF
ncbi:MAG: hypothetical protein H6Q20_2196 [Bacteroidetes bacterium]|jgi:hypothetical protein|nr:hypothetical protein [Bacteroidota bacterium]